MVDVRDGKAAGRDFKVKDGSRDEIFYMEF